MKRYLLGNVGPPSIVSSSAMATNDRPSKKGACNAVSPSRSKVRRCFALAPKTRARSPVSEAESWIGRAHFRRRWQSLLRYLRLHLPRSAPAQSFLTAVDARGDGQDGRVQTQLGRGVRVGEFAVHSREHSHDACGGDILPARVRRHELHSPQRRAGQCRFARHCSATERGLPRRPGLTGVAGAMQWQAGSASPYCRPT